MNKPPSFRLGIDLGGTKIEGILIDADGTIVRRERLPTPQDDYGRIIDTIDDVILKLSRDPGLPVGIGTPGSVSRVSPLMRNANSTCLNGKPLHADLEQHLGRPVRLANDADCFTLSEASDGAASSGSVVFGVILGTGVGGGITIDGKLVSGVNGITGEWGHNPMPNLPTVALRRPCFCGRSDCIETWLSGPGLAATYHLQTTDNVTAEMIAGRCEAGDPSAIKVMASYCEQLAAAMSVVLNILDPDTVVLGGGVSNIAMLYRELPLRLPRYVFSDHVATRIVRASHGDSSGVRGAAWLWP